MPKRIVKGVGMMQRVSLQYDPREPGAIEAVVKAWDAAVPVAQPGDMLGDALDRENAARCRAIIEKSKQVNPPGGPGATEADAEWIAAEWLAAYNAMLVQRAKLIAGEAIPNSIGFMLLAAQEMGRLQERMWWRARIDPQSGKRPEELALGKRAQEKAISRATEARRIQARDTKPDWHDAATLDAHEIRRKHPSYSRWRIAGEIHEKFGVSRNRCDKVLRANGIE